MKKSLLLLVLVLSMGACSTKESTSQQNEKAFLEVVKGKTLVHSNGNDYATFTSDGKFVTIIGNTPPETQQWMFWLAESETVATYRQDDDIQTVDWKFTINGDTGITITAGNHTIVTTFKK